MKNFNIPENSSAITSPQQAVSTRVTATRQITNEMQCGVIIAWHRTMKIQIRKTQSIFDLEIEEKNKQIYLSYV